MHCFPQILPYITLDFGICSIYEALSSRHVLTVITHDEIKVHFQAADPEMLFDFHWHERQPPSITLSWFE